MKALGLPFIALIAVAFAVFSIVRSHPRRPRTEPPSPPPVSRFTNTIAAVGLVEPGSELIEIATPLSGIVVKLPVLVGQVVSMGEGLVELDTRPLQAARASRTAALAAAEAGAQTALANADDQKDQLERAEQLARTAVISPDELSRRRFALRIADARLVEARAAAATARAELAAVEVELDRSIIRAPIAATVLQVNVRPGEFATAGVLPTPLMVLGSLKPLHVRVDVDEQEGLRVRPEAEAIAHRRGDARAEFALKFVRFEPLVVPKRSLTGGATERVDTRVLQVIYEVVGSEAASLFIGQQVDVFIDGHH